MKLVMVEWVDSYGVSSSWEDTSDISKVQPVNCVSVGWVLFEDDTVVTVLPHKAILPGGGTQGCGEMTIPRQAIISVKPLIIQPQELTIVEKSG